MNTSGVRTGLWVAVVVLIVLHQDVWFWEDATLLFGFLPVSLAYHMGISTAAAIVWFLMVHFAWPLDSGETEEKGNAG